MLQLWTLSGELVTGIPVEELETLSDVTGLKQRLNQLHGVAPRFRQRILFRGDCLEDTVSLHSATGDLHLVLLPFADRSQ